MRAKMKTIRETREDKLRKDSWIKWRQYCHSRLSAQHYAGRLVLLTFNRWKTKLYEVDHLEAVADEFRGLSGTKALERCWNRWVHVNDITFAERILVERVGLRILGEGMEVWKRHT
jgi:protein SFI1